jgi:hypothetical protein
MKPNGAQKAVLVVGSVLLLCLAMFPPWREAAEREVDFRKDIGRGFILSPPLPVAVDCYFVGCKTAPPSYFHVLIYRELLFNQLITVGSVGLALLWVLRSHRDGTRASFASQKTRLQSSALLALLIPFVGQYPLGAELASIPEQIIRHDELWLIPMIFMILGYLLCVCIIFLLLSAVMKTCATVSKRRAVARL